MNTITHAIQTPAATSRSMRKLFSFAVAIFFLLGTVWFGAQLAKITASLAAPAIF